MTRHAVCLLLFLGLGMSDHPAAAQSSAAADAGAAALYDSGRTYDVFVAGAKSRVETWRANTAAARDVPPELVARLEAAGGHWRLLAIAEDWCGDSSQSVPFLAALAGAARNVELRVVNSTAGKTLMEAHPTPDGRAATPTVLLLDATGAVHGAFVERPTALQRLYLEKKDALGREAVHDEMAVWYRENRGRDAMSEIVGMIEQASRR